MFTVTKTSTSTTNLKSKYESQVTSNIITNNYKTLNTFPKEIASAYASRFLKTVKTKKLGLHGKKTQRMDWSLPVQYRKLLKYIWRTEYSYTKSKGLLKTVIKTDAVLIYSLSFKDTRFPISVTKAPEKQVQGSH